MAMQTSGNTDQNSSTFSSPVSWRELIKIWRRELVKSGEDDTFYLAKRSFLLWYCGYELAWQDFIRKADDYVDSTKIDELNLKFKQACDERKNGKPWAYIWHKSVFLGREYSVDENVLIPRSDSEILWEECVTAAKEIYRQNRRSLRILEVCTGSGCLLISLVLELVAANIPIELSVGTDLSVDALRIAELNAEKLAENIDFSWLAGDMFDALDKAKILNSEGKFDLILVNPPYIAAGEMQDLDKEVKDFEPEMALTDYADGLSFYRRIFAEAPKYLAERGRLFVEHGYRQREDIMKIAEDNNWQAIVRRNDYANLPRVGGFVLN